MNKKGGLIFAFIIILVIVIAVAFFFIFDNKGSDYTQTEIIEEEQDIIFIPESREAAKARQIQTLYDKIEIEKLQDLKSEELCEIYFDDDEIKSDDLGRASFSFDESLVGEGVKLSCDQFERFGISGDELLTTIITSTSALDEDFSCDYGSVTTPTVYFWFVSSEDLETDYCVAPLTVLPLEENEGECFSDEVIQAMKDDCEDAGAPYYSIPDSNGCETIYCGWEEAQNLCPSNSLLGQAETDCGNDGGTFVSYTDSDNCAQIRCSSCPREEETINEMNSCGEKGGVPAEEFDHETGCTYIYCEAPEEEVEESPPEDESEEESEHGEDEIPEGEEDFDERPPV
jgi:hypothetical protein